MQRAMKTNYPQQQGLYDPQNEHDACGVGMIVDINGKASHKIVLDGIKILDRLLHRGAVGADSQTGDGAGILTQIPDGFFRKTLNFKLPNAGEYAVMMAFLPQGESDAEKCRDIIRQCAHAEGFEVLGSRDVNPDKSAIGGLALETCPRIEQFFFSNKGLLQEELERALYLLRRVIENRAESELGARDDFYICSLSSRTIVYKGLLNAPQLKKFYPDLSDENFESAIALIHQRYSTNTFPSWPLAQPFRYLAHNGEINTLRGNINQMRMREEHFESPLFGGEIKKLLPIIRPRQSDSASLDNAVEFYHEAGRGLAHTMLMLVPQAWGKSFHISKDIQGFFEYHSGVSEPWDGPAALAFTNGITAGALLDRNGLRPARYAITKSGLFVLASETGVLDIPASEIANKGRLRPGEIIYIDTQKHRIMRDTEIKTILARAKPYRRWVQENRITLPGIFESSDTPSVGADLILRQKMFGYSREDIDLILKPMALDAKEPIGSMGNAAALSVLSEKPQLLYDYFKQLFAQVTNPPIDPIREKLVMSLMTYIGNCGNSLVETPRLAHLLKLPCPILTNHDIACIRSSKIPTFQSATIKAQFSAQSGEKGLASALESLCDEAEKLVREGKTVIILSDKNLSYGYAPIPMLLAVSAVNLRLVRKSLRYAAGIVAETGEAREIMHFALLLGYGATAINPYLAIETIADMSEGGILEGIDGARAVENYIEAIKKGLLKIMSKMGISTLRSYRQAQIFEAVGLSKEFIDKYFEATSSRIGGIGIAEVAHEALERYHGAFYPKIGEEELLDNFGKYKFRRGGENHLWTPQTISLLQRAVRNNDKNAYLEYSSLINNQAQKLCTLRGLFKFKGTSSVPLSEVESVESIVRRFVSGAMSFGALSPEAHETIAIAMNRMGAMSNCGEGGEDESRNGTEKASAIRQIASGRFGVTASYLANAKEIQIKIAQGAKPGEGGQLPGYKVNSAIAKIRHSIPGVTLISPPPHHDIYSIEDLAELIYDLRNSNENARISVKLVSEVGVGTVAAGVAKAKADMVLISGHDGGTGASPLTSIKYAGAPWELGLAETHQTLCLNGLRGRIKVQVDGQIKTGRDVVVGALLGAEEFGFATAILVSIGCVMMRVCHKNCCPVGVATQDEELRKKFKGAPEHVVNYLRFVAEEAREILASLGLRSIDEAVGRSDLLDKDEALDFWKSKNLDFSSVFKPAVSNSERFCKEIAPRELPNAYDKKLVKYFENSISNAESLSGDFEIHNFDRSVGAMLSNHVVKKWGDRGLQNGTITANFKGCAGQSFGAFLCGGIRFNLEGDANDFIGKSLSGGEIVIRAPRELREDAGANVIAGNVIGYGATSGKIYLNGIVGERFAIRNSGAVLVCEGSGDHCCEYMTGGRVVVLGNTGFNFAAGMTGGLAYVLDLNGEFDRRCNLESVDLESIPENSESESELRSIIEDYHSSTDSKVAGEILSSWSEFLPKFVKVFPIDYRNAMERKS